MRFGLYSNITRDVGFSIANQCADLLLKYGATPVFEKEFECNEFVVKKTGVEFDDLSSCDLIISIGGDGTLLSVVSKYRQWGIPFVGINKGSIGFLTEIELDRIEESIVKLINSDYTICNRFQLKCKVIDKDDKLKGEYICLNDFVVTHGDHLNIIKMQVWIDGQYVERFYGDGIVVATPTGSTAYSLAAGGPILMPEIKNILLTPLNPHTLQASRYCLNYKSTIEIRFENFEYAPIISPDGRTGVDLAPHDRIIITGCEDFIKTVNMGYSGFFETVRSKIAARGIFYEHKK